jgi:hypothetical protein
VRRLTQVFGSGGCSGCSRACRGGGPGERPWIPEIIQQKLVRLKPLDDGFYWCMAEKCVYPSSPHGRSLTFLDTSAARRRNAIASGESGMVCRSG